MPVSPMTGAQTRVVDPVQTTHARGYTQPDFVGDRLFPIAEVALRGTKMLKFNKQSFKLAQTARAPGSNILQHQIGYESDPINLAQQALAAVTPFELQEEAGASLSFDLHRDGLDEVLEIMGLSREVAQATTATTAANYAAAHVDTPAGGDLWSDGASNPKVQVSDGKETIRKAIGRYPNLMVISPTAFKLAGEHPQLEEIVKRNGGQSVTTDLLARYFDIDEVVVGGAVSAADDDTLSDVWGNGLVMAYVSTPMGGNRRSRRRPSFGYTHRLKNYPMVTETFWNSGTNSHQSNAFDEWSVDMVGPDAGYLITTTDGN